MADARETLIGIGRDLLVGLAKTGAKAAARMVDSVLEDLEDHAADVTERIKKGRVTAQGVGARPRKHVDVEVTVIDAKEEPNK